MAIGQYEYVFIRSIHIKSRVMLHDPEIKGRKKLGTAQ
jgi:hypothetical protein